MDREFIVILFNGFFFCFFCRHILARGRLLTPECRFYIRTRIELPKVIVISPWQETKSNKRFCDRLFVNL